MAAGISLRDLGGWNGPKPQRFKPQPPFKIRRFVCFAGFGGHLKKLAAIYGFQLHSLMDVVKFSGNVPHLFKLVKNIPASSSKLLSGLIIPWCNRKIEDPWLDEPTSWSTRGCESHGRLLDRKAASFLSSG